MIYLVKNMTVTTSVIHPILMEILEILNWAPIQELMLHRLNGYIVDKTNDFEFIIII